MWDRSCWKNGKPKYLVNGRTVSFLYFGHYSYWTKGMGYYYMFPSISRNSLLNSWQVKPHAVTNAPKNKNK